MMRSGMVRIGPAILEFNTGKSSPSTACFPAYVLDHRVFPATVQRKSSAMLATNGRALFSASPAKICSRSCLFCAVLMGRTKDSTGIERMSATGRASRRELTYCKLTRLPVLFSRVCTVSAVYEQSRAGYFSEMRRTDEIGFVAYKKSRYGLGRGGPSHC